MPNTILCVFEGAKTEPHLFDTIERSFFSQKKVIRVVFARFIYDLWQKICDEPDFDTVEILRELIPDKSELAKVKRDDVSEIHLFFDHDAHSHARLHKSQNECNEIIRAMLNTFNNESEQGRLWISYPMVEALKHCKKVATRCYENCIWKIAKNIEYKNFVSTITDYPNLTLLSRTNWLYFVAINIQKTYSLLKDRYKQLDYKNDIENLPINDIQQLIHDKQVAKFIIPQNSVAVISAFPLFLLYYFGEALFSEVQSLKIVKKCSFSCLC